jgi:hypothetical protein
MELELHTDAMRRSEVLPRRARPAVTKTPPHSYMTGGDKAPTLHKGVH